MSVDRYMELFQGRRDVFAQQMADGSYVPVRRPITREDYEAHLRGDVTYGIYTVTRINGTKFIVFDVDTMDPDPRIRIFTALRELGIHHSHTILEFSGRKGFHIWVPFQGMCPASVAYRAGRAVLQQAGIDKLEVFPKQEFLDGLKEFGNLIKLPLGVHRVSGEKSRLFGKWYNVEPLHVVQLADLADHYREPTRPQPQPIRVRSAGAYGKTALINECKKVAEAPEGGRNEQLNRSAYSLYGLVAGGVLSEDDVYDNLTHAAAVAGLGTGETVKTLASAKTAGMARPLGPKP